MKLKKLLPIIGLGIFIYILHSVGLNKIANSFIGLNWKYFPLVLFFLVFHLFLLTYKWTKIIKLQGFKLRFKEAVKYYLIGCFYGFITPSRAGSLIRASYLKKKTNRPLVECASGIVIERIFDLISILILASLGAIYVANQLTGLFTTLILVLIGLVVAGIFFASKKRARFILRFFYKLLIPKKLKVKARDYFYDFYNSIPKITKLIYPFILTIITWIATYTFIYTIALMFNINIPYWIFIILNPISTIIGMIPITMSGLGTREATLITLFNLFGIAPELTLSMSLTAMVIGSAIPALIGFILSLKEDRIR